MADEKIPSQEEYLSQWLKDTIGALKKSIKKRGISDERNNLLESIEGHLVFANPITISRIVLQFFTHGRYVDMGVGRGVPIGSQAAKADFHKHRHTKNTEDFKRGQLLKYNRKPKKWYSPTITGREKDLGRLLNEFFEIRTLQIIESSLKNNIEISF